MTTRRAPIGVAAAVTAACLVAACGGDDGEAARGDGDGSGGTIRVLAAASLSDAFDAGDDGSSVAGTITFGDSNGGTDLSLAASSSAVYCYHVTID